MKPFCIIIASFIILVTSCISEKTIIRKYYTLQMPEDTYNTLPDTSKVIPGKCEIGRIDINPVYEKNQIVNRNESNEITYYMYHHWAVRPDEAIREMLQEYLQKKKLFENVSTRFARSIPDYIFETSVNDLEIIEIDKSFSAHVNLEFKLILNNSDSILIRHQADRIEPLKQKNINLFAREVSNILFEELEVFAKLIRVKEKVFYSSER
jgi:ABC-type uncharacterized transport system auxiliary subunit